MPPQLKTKTNNFHDNMKGRCLQPRARVYLTFFKRTHIIVQIIWNAHQNSWRIVYFYVKVLNPMIVVFLLVVTFFHNVYLLQKCHRQQGMHQHGCSWCTNPQILRPRALFYRTDCTRRSKFLTQALDRLCDTCQEQFPRVSKRQLTLLIHLKCDFYLFAIFHFLHNHRKLFCMTYLRHS